ncbi:MAG: GTPase Era, partial [Bryobacteraceae bacterium]
MSKRKHRTGFVSILGRPNAGKSTLLNAFLGEKLAIVSSKPQTTRTSVQGVVTLPDVQIVFVDTPGIHKTESLLDKRMMETVRAALEDRDLLLFVTDGSQSFKEADRQAIDMIRKVSTPAFLVLNKIDRVEPKQKVLPLIEQYKAAHEFADYFPVSAQDGDGIPELRDAIVERLPQGPPMFPEDYLTDQPERFLVAEMIREQVLRVTKEEVPHAVAVLVETWEDSDKLTRIGAAIYVERPGQKAIVIGAGGSVLKKIGTMARLGIEKMLGRKVYLELFVKVRPHWREEADFLQSIDWRASS